jgi:hypothetical protein
MPGSEFGLTVAASGQVAQEFRSPLNGMVGLTMALCKSPALSAPIKKQQLGKLSTGD